MAPEDYNISMATKPRDGLGRVIPDDHFENDPGPVRDPLDSMSEKQLADFRARTEELRAKAFPKGKR